MDVDGQIATLGDVYQSAVDLTARLAASAGDDRERQELADVIQTKLKTYESSLASLDLQIEDELDEDAKRRYLVSLDRLKENLRLARSRFRKAQIQSKRNNEANWAAQRARLFARDEKDTAETGRGGKERERKTAEELVVGKSEEITSALRDMHRMAQAEVIKSHLTIDELEYSSRSLQELEHKYGAYDVVLHGARRMVKHIQGADAVDRRNMLMSLAFLATVIVWIIWRRILRRPVMLLLWTMGKLLGIVRVASKPFTAGSGGSSVAVSETEYIATTVAEAVIEAIVTAVTADAAVTATVEADLEDGTAPLPVSSAVDIESGTRPIHDEL